MLWSSFVKKTSVVLLAGLLAGCQTAQGPSSPSPAASNAASASVQSVSLPVVSYAPATAVERGFSALVLNAATGEQLYDVDADAPRYPASLTKMMTLYLLFEAVSDGRYSLSSPLEISANAAAQPPAKIGLKAGSTITVQQAARALAVKSANDVAVAVAENIAGSEAAFARQMTQQARALGMGKTRFVNATGLPDPAQVTSARDMAKLGLALKRRFPQYSSYYRQKSFTYNGRSFRATNNLIGKVPGVDGLKTGYIRMSGYNLVATARRAGKQLIVVVIGGKSETARDQEVTRLIEANF
ncbi:D-alanyl-D-alanine carboxypeptidase family protein [uncultured Roseibium sp.]|uniref:D-alanyl-D-alanine carboxypeptidase family protein n=1 Tax=uncultured Roseibium sp. TaxID=1936171 RepID=UPI0026335A68|nr:D-alanyl-D-alanine carboxypeptidase family protein [uncultured Roseibium sp.]